MLFGVLIRRDVCAPSHCQKMITITFCVSAVQAMVETARIVSAEGAALVERQTTALMGDIKKLQSQIQVNAHERHTVCMNQNELELDGYVK